jgi:hypothetical protein
VGDPLRHFNSTSLHVNSEAKNYVGYILNITEHALIQLYWACRDGTGFPGATIETEDPQVTASAILKALGLKEPGETEPLNNETEASTTVPTYPVQALQREAQIPLLTPEDWMFSATDSTSRIDSKANSTPEMLLTNGQTRRRAPSVGPRQTQRSPTPVDPPFPFHASSMSAGGLPTASNNPDSQISSLTNPTIPHVGLHESPDISFPAPGYAENADNDLLLHFFGPTAAAIMPGYNLGEFDIPPELRLNDDPGSHLPE